MAGGVFANKGYMPLGSYGPEGGIEGGGVPQAPAQTPAWMGPQGPAPIRPAGGMGGMPPRTALPARPAGATDARLAQMQKAQAAARAMPRPPAGRAPGMGMAQPARGAAPMGGMAAQYGAARGAMKPTGPSASMQGAMDKLRGSPGSPAPMTGAFATGKLKMPGMP